MLNEKDILIRLQNGEDAQNIANELANALNAANKTYIAQKEEEAKKKADEAKKNDLAKRDSLQRIFDDLYVWVKTYYGDDIAQAFSAEFNADVVLEIFRIFGDYGKVLQGLKAVVPVAPAGTKKLTNSGVNPDKVLDSFLKNMGW
jgi:hypothetical protein